MQNQHEAILAILHYAQALETDDLNISARAFFLNKIVCLAALLLEGV